MATGTEARRHFFDPQDRAQKFQSVESIFPYQVIHRDHKILELPRWSEKDVPDFGYEFHGKSYSIEEFSERTRTNALLILKDGEIVTEIYRNGSSAGTRFISFSVGKSVTSTLVGMALEDGYIDSLADPLTKYLPALSGSAYDGVNIRDALQMLSGVGWNEENYDWNDNTRDFVRLWRESISEHRYRFVEGANTLRRVSAAGTKWNYSTMETCILGWLIENATQRRFSRYLEERLWQPAGMESDAGWLLDGPVEIGREMAGGMLVATLRDLGRFGHLIINDGKVNGQQLVSGSWVREATSMHSPATQYGKLNPDFPTIGYGYQWWLIDGGSFEAQGVYGQLINIVPEERLVFVKLSYWPNAWQEDMYAECHAFFNAVVESL